MPLDLVSFVRKWNASSLTERSAAPQHFRDLCEVLDVPHPTEADEIGANYTYEKRVTKAGTGEGGYADVWKRGYFAWEYKSKGGDLKKAYKQLNEYHEALENPPLLIVCDFEHFEVHTKFENLPTRVYAFKLDDLLGNRDTATCALPPIEVLRHVFGDYNQLRPGVASARVTEAAARDFLRLAQQLELERAAAPGPSKERIAPFLMRLVFCLFADSVGLLPNHAFRRLVTNTRHSPINFNRMFPVLLEAMSQPDGFFGVDTIPYFNGDLFRPNDDVIPLNHADLGILHSAAQHDWSYIEPAIFGTLFERSLDAAKRSMIGAHYTSTEDILLLVEPVVMTPLRRRWAAVQEAVLAALRDEEGSDPATTPGAPDPDLGTRGLTEAGAPSTPAASSPGWVGSQKVKGASPRRLRQPTLKLNRPALTLLQDWAAELSAVRILDPACGSGNFLYVALKRLLDLWHEARVFGVAHGLTLALDPIPHPGQLFGIEIDFYAHEIASIVVWIGFLQWKHDHGIKDQKEPLLQKLTNIEHNDAILRYDADGNPYEPTWPQADYIIGNPPFLGGKLLRRELGDTYVDAVFDLYRGHVKAESDLVAYWFEKARAQLVMDRVRRVGLLATQAIRGGANRHVLGRIVESATIFWAWSDRKWLLQGAAVHVSMVGFDRGVHESVVLDGAGVEAINSDLTTGANITKAKRLPENQSLCFMGTTKVGAFELEPEIARRMLEAPVNPNMRPNSDVVKPYINARDFTGRVRGYYIVDFGYSLQEKEAALFEFPFQHLVANVLPERSKNRRENYKQLWWLHGEPRPELRRAVEHLSRYILTPGVSKHRIYEWFPSSTLPDHAVFAIAREDDYFFGVLHSRAHEIWARAQGTQLREVESGFRYTPSSTFDTFPFPWPPGTEPSESDSTIVRAIADAARELVRLRDNWLNPKDAAGQPLPESDLKKRTLTNLYNARPQWLANAHATLDRAVFAAYGWPEDPATLPKQDILARLLAFNHQRADSQPGKARKKASRRRVESSGRKVRSHSDSSPSNTEVDSRPAN